MKCIHIVTILIAFFMVASIGLGAQDTILSGSEVHCTIQEPSYTYMLGYHIHPALLHNKIYSDYNSDISFDEWYQFSNPAHSNRNPLLPGDFFCLKEPLPSAFSSITPPNHYTPWHIWQVYGSIRGFTLPDFIRYNLERVDGIDRSSLSVSDLRIYQHRPDMASYYFNKKISYDKRSAASGNNSQLLDMISDLSSSSSLDYLGPFSDQDKEQHEILEVFLQNYRDDLGLDLKILVIHKSLVEDVTLPVATIASHAFITKFGTTPQYSQDAQKGIEVMLVVIKDVGLAYTYPQDSPLLIDNPYFMDETLVQSLSYLDSYKEGSYQGTFTSLLRDLKQLVSVNLKTLSS